ncbi:MAG: alanine--tRNA ligase [Mycoplasmoidaceae bacterium]
MKNLKANQIRKEWLSYFKSKKHYILESQSLVPINDNSLLLINSGIATLKNYFSGVDSPISNRLANSQKCIRTNDIENVGLTSRHHTLFEMLGNFSIGDYFKEEAIEFGFDFLTKKLEMPKSKLYITVYKDDEEAYNKWLKLGIAKKNIIKCGKDRNFWDIGSGPCGPCTEIYFDRGSKYDPNKKGIELFEKDIENDRYVEIWNIVFSEFNNDGKGKLTPLARKNIDTGAGLERLASIMQEVPTDFDIDSFEPIIKAISKKTNDKYDSKAYFSKSKKQKNINKNYIVIADHIKAATFMIADGITPGNKDRGYILRRLIRRAIVSLSILSIRENILEEIVKGVIKSMKAYYPYLLEKQELILEVLNKEYKAFEETIKNCKSLFIKAASTGKIDGKTLFNLVDTHGFPLEIIKEIENDKELQILTSIFNVKKSEIIKDKKQIKFDFDGFNKAFEKHREISKSSKKETGLNIQNSELVNLNVQSEFIYGSYYMKSKIVELFDNNFKKVKKLKNKDGYIVFDKTCFYATSGGQIHDTGKIEEFDIVEVIKGPNGQHIHAVKNASLELSKTYFISINEKDRVRISANHTSEHLLHSALKNILDKNIKQEGAFKSAQKLTFDFQFNRKITQKEIDEIEEWIKDKIAKEIRIEVLHMSLEEAKKIGAMAYFEDKYKKIDGDLRVIKMGKYSTELCGGTHLTNTKNIQDFKIIDVFTRGSNTWRIEAVTTNYNVKKFVLDAIEASADNINFWMKEYKKMNIRSKEFTDALIIFRECLVHPDKHFSKIKHIESEIKKIYETLKIDYEKKKELFLVKSLKEKFSDKILFLEGIIIKNVDSKVIVNALTELINEKPDKTFFVININEDKIQYFAAQNENNKKRNLNEIIQRMNKASGGKGGGKPNFAQGGTSNTKSLEKIKSVLLGLNKN